MFITVGFLLSTIIMFIIFGYTENVYVAIFGAVFIFLVINTLLYRSQVQAEKQLRNSNMQEISNMSGVEFEEYLRCLLKNLGYKVQKTSTTGDFGADLILKDGKQTIAVQAKRYSSNVGIKAVQEVLGAKSYYGVSDAWVITNSYFTNAAKQLAERSNVRLIDRRGLVELAFEAGIYLDGEPSNQKHTSVIEEEPKPAFNFSTINPKPVYNFSPLDSNASVSTKAVPKTNKVLCPVCDSEMVVRTSKSGKFYGCSSFPKCRGTRSY